MSEVMKLIQEADEAAIEMERARSTMEAAKIALETAKEGFENARSLFDQTLIRADELGVSRAKIKKLTEDRISALVASGLIASSDEKVKIPRPPKPAKKNSKAESDTKTSSTEIIFDTEDDQNLTPLTV